MQLQRGAVRPIEPRPRFFFGQNETSVPEIVDNQRFFGNQKTYSFRPIDKRGGFVVSQRLRQREVKRQRSPAGRCQPERLQRKRHNPSVCNGNGNETNSRNGCVWATFKAISSSTEKASLATTVIAFLSSDALRVSTSLV